jgi:hypothetical protein
VAAHAAVKLVVLGSGEGLFSQQLLIVMIESPNHLAILSRLFAAIAYTHYATNATHAI